MGEAEVTREEARKLLGGYATGSLSDAERKLLFDAALEDQELFDELAAEQALKELIEAPGARARLIAATESKRQSWWVWGSLATAAAVLAIWITVPRSVEAPKTAPVEIAEVRQAPPEPAASTAPAPTPKAAEELRARREEPKTEAPAAPEQDPVIREKSVAAEAAASQSAPFVAIAPPPPAAKPVAAARPTAARGDFVANDAAGGALDPGLAVRVAGAPANGPLSYEFLPSGNVRINSAAEGTLSVRSGERILYVPAAIRPGVPVEVLIPVDVSTIRIALTDSPQNATIDVQVPR